MRSTLVSEGGAQSFFTEGPYLDSSGRRTYKRLLRTAATDANGAGFLQEVEVFLLELETFDAASQAHNR